MLNPGDVIGKFKIVRSLGSGGMADVYEAEDPSLDRRVAIKVLPPEMTRNKQLIQRFEKEVRAAASLNHHGIVTVFEVGEHDGLHFYTMRMLTGGDLRDRIEAGLNEVEALAILRELADAFAHAHSRGFVHRDVKPENIIFDAQGYPVLTDFGIAKAVDSGTRVTATGVSVGTPRYISPEQARGRTVDARADLYSLGVILYEMLTGNPPYDGEESLAVIFQHVTEPIPRLPEAHARLQPLVDALMAKDPDDRPDSAEALIVLIDQYTPSSGAQDTRADPRSTQQNPVVARLRTPSTLRTVSGTPPLSSTTTAETGTATEESDQAQREAEQAQAEADAERKRQADAEAERARAEQEEAARLREQQEKAAAEQRRKEQQAKEKAEAQRRAEQEKREAEARRQAEEKRARDEEARRIAAQKREEEEARRQAEQQQREEAARAMAEAKRQADEAARRKKAEAARVKAEQAEQKRQQREADKARQQERKAARQRERDAERERKRAAAAAVDPAVRRKRQQLVGGVGAAAAIVVLAVLLWPEPGPYRLPDTGTPLPLDARALGLIPTVPADALPRPALPPAAEPEVVAPAPVEEAPPLDAPEAERLEAEQRARERERAEAARREREQREAAAQAERERRAAEEAERRREQEEAMLRELERQREEERQARLQAEREEAERQRQQQEASPPPAAEPEEDRGRDRIRRIPGF